MPHEARAELRAEEGRPGPVQEARGGVIADAGAGDRQLASDYSIILPEMGVAMVDGTSITDVALERKLAAAVKRDAATKVRIGHATKTASARLDAIRALVKRAGVTNVEVYVASDAPTVVLTISAKGTLYVGANVVADADLDKELVRVAKLTKKLVIVADGNTPAAVVQKLVERAKAAGLTELSFATR